jgi:hypothetical protein
MTDTPDITPEATDSVDAIKAQCAALMAELKKRGRPDMTDAEFAAHIEKVEAESAARRESIKKYHEEVERRRGWNIKNVDPSFEGQRCYHCGKPIYGAGLILNKDLDEYYEGDDKHLCDGGCLCGVDYTIWRRWYYDQNPQAEEELVAEIMRRAECEAVAAGTWE